MKKFAQAHAKKFLFGAGAAIAAVFVMGYLGVKGPIYHFLAPGAILAGLYGAYGLFTRKTY